VLHYTREHREAPFAMVYRETGTQVSLPIYLFPCIQQVKMILCAARQHISQIDKNSPQGDRKNE
jgi:hypothetical protein